MILDCNEVIPNRLWVGRFIRPEEVKLLKKLEITNVLSLQCDEDLSYYGISARKMLKAYEEAGIELRRVATPDFNRQALAGNLPQCVREIEQLLAPQWTRIYLHCSAGINRAPTAAAAYLIRSRNMSAEEAHEYVCSRRHCNPYLDVLVHYERSLRTDAPAGESGLKMPGLEEM